MALIFTQEKTLSGQKKMQQLLILAVVAIALITSIVLWAGFSKPKSPAVILQNTSSFSAQQVQIDFGTLKDKTLEKLESPPSQIPLPQAVGRSNPFISF